MEKDCGCKGRRWLLPSAKLGRCIFCIRATALGALFGWVVAIGANSLQLHPVVLTVVLLVAGGFTLLFLAHLITFLRIAAPLKTDSELNEMDGAKGMDRRRFVRDMAATMAVFGAAVIGGSRSETMIAFAQVQKGSDIIGRVVDQNGDGCPGVRVEIWEVPPCELLIGRNRVPACRQHMRRFTFTVQRANDRKGIKVGDFSFETVPANTNFIICVCGGSCKLVNNNQCVYTCNGPQTPVNSGAAGGAANAGNLVLTDCEC